MPKLFKQNHSRLLGIDIRSSIIQLLEFGNDNGRILIKQGDFEPLLKRGVRRKTKRAAIAVSGMAVFSKTLSVDKGLSEYEIEMAVCSEAIKAMGPLRQECYMDFHCLCSNAADSKRLNLAVVAYRKDRVDRLIEALADAGIKTEVVDLDYFALQRALQLLSDQCLHKNDQSTSTTAIINVDSSHSTFVAIRGQDLIYTRSEYQNNAPLLAKAKHYLGVRDWLRGYAENGSKHSGRRLDLAKLMAPSINAQLNRFLQCYSTSEQDQLDQLILSGECVLVPEIADYIQEQLDLPCIVANPFIDVRYSDEVDAEFLEAVAPAFMLCSGLALRKHPHEYN